MFFDNLQLIHARGPLVEETHFYPFGLTMAGISSRAAGSLENRRKFNEGTELAGNEFSDGLGLEWYETTFRSYDPQIGRFHQIDLLSFLSDYFSVYCFSTNDPILKNDPTGLKDTTKTTLPDVVVTATIPKLKGGPYNGISYYSIKTFNDRGIGSSYSISKTIYLNSELLERLNCNTKSLEEMAKKLQMFGTLLGGSNVITGLQSLKDYKALMETLKSGKIQPNLMMLLTIAASITYMEGLKSEKGAAAIKQIISTYIEIHSTVSNPNPPPASGVYVIQISSVSSGTGGGSFYSSTVYYDVSTNQYLGSTQ